jgi:3-deoxy-7-phosphoheptulonate synthase
MTNYLSRENKRQRLNSNVEDTNLDYYEELIKPNILKEKLPITNEIENLVKNTRNSIQNILHNNDKRLLFIVGPCSIHNIEEAKSYGRLLKELADDVKDKILIVMRVYFEKPRTTVGWKGLINDPNLDNSFDVNTGLHKARELLLYLNSIGLPCGYEILDTITPQYIADLISWGAIGARTSESQVHRQMVSGLSMPVGFKNGTSGDIKIAADAITSAAFPHCFMGITNTGEPAICKTLGNRYCHVILRGGKKPNFASKFVKNAEKIISIHKSNPKIMIDCSHGNSGKDHRRQPTVLRNILKQIKNGSKSIFGAMLESNINEGKQKLSKSKPLKEGVSITDSCLSFEQTNMVIKNFYNQLV